MRYTCATAFSATEVWTFTVVPSSSPLARRTKNLSRTAVPLTLVPSEVQPLGALLVAAPSLAKTPMSRSPGSTVAGSATACAVVSVANDDAVTERTTGDEIGGGGGGGAAVVKLQVASAASGLPAVSVTPVAPPLTVATYAVEVPRSALGSSVAVRVTAS